MKDEVFKYIKIEIEESGGFAIDMDDDFSMWETWLDDPCVFSLITMSSPGFYDLEYKDIPIFIEFLNAVYEKRIVNKNIKRIPQSYDE